MPATGYGASLVGVALGTFPNIKEITVEGLEVEVKEVACVTDTDKVPTKLPNKVREGPMQAVMVYDAASKVLYGQMRTYAKGHTQDTFTGTDSVGNTHAGPAYITKVGNLRIDTDNEMVYDVTITPVTTWAYTPAA